MKLSKIILFVFMVISLPAYADDAEKDDTQKLIDGSYTLETVRYVLDCMADLGGLNDENLYTCACRHDAIFSRMSFADYEEGRTYERNRAMPGEKGGFFRDNERGEQFYEKLKAVREVADSQCIAVKTVKKNQ